MLKKTIHFLTSTKISMVLLFLLAIAMAMGTFVENDYGTAVARAKVYEAWWFELIFIWLSVNFLMHIKKYRLFSKEKLPIGVFHLAFVIIVIGAGVTRYIGKEGSVRIRKGQTVHFYDSAKKYLQVRTQDTIIFSEKINPIIPKMTSERFSFLKDKKTDLTISLEEYLSNATEHFLQGEDTLLVLSVQGNPIFIKQNHSYENTDFDIHFSKPKPIQNSTPTQVWIWKDSLWNIQSSDKLFIIQSSQNQMGTMESDNAQPLSFQTTYSNGKNAFTIKEIKENVQRIFISQAEKSQEKNPDRIKINIYNQNQPVATAYPLVNPRENQWFVFTFQGKKYEFTLGSKKVDLPFSLTLNKFELQRYPGSESPSGYASYVRVEDAEKSFDYKIYMNHVLDYRGFRFYQASYDDDEKGTLLTLTQDWWGTHITYLGYGLLFLGMLLTLFAPKSRFGFLNNRLKKLKKQLLPVLLLAVSVVNAQSVTPYIVPQEKAEKYGQLIVQDLDGRMKPLTTLAYEIARKVSGKTTVSIEENNQNLKLSPEQFLLGIQLSPKDFSELPLIKIDPKKSAVVFDILKIEPTDRLKFTDFLNPQGEYLLRQEVENTHKIKPAERLEWQKELLKTDEKFNIFYALFKGDFLRIFPNKKDHNNTWFTANQSQENFDEEDAVFVRNITNYYLSALYEDIQKNDFTQSDELLGYLDTYQQKAGAEVYPSENEIKAELFYTRTHIGNYLFGSFMLLGIFLLAVVILQLFSRKKWLNIAFKIGIILSAFGWIIFTFDLGLRWYIAKHPPWSDGFEMLLFVSWCVLLFGLLLVRKSKFTLPLSLLFSGILLFVSFLDWLNPEITTLMPVLHSYWLKIHVAVIVASYAPLALSACLGLMTLLFIIGKPQNPTKRWETAVKELQIVNEMAMTIGLFLLTIGTFLGGIWANESWGRYWAWDPKETWALVSILVYSIVLHLRLIPECHRRLVFALSSMWAFSSIVMTSYGVNYYLTGLHSYATGDPVPIPNWVYISVSLLITISLWAYFRDRKMKK